MDLNMFDFRFFRNAIAGVLTAFNNSGMYITQVIDSKPKKYDMPIYYEFGEDAQFMRDFFYDLPSDCNIPQHSEGMHITRPYGVINLKNISIKMNEISNRFNRGEFENIVVDEESGAKSSIPLSANLFNVPLDLTFDLELYTDGLFQSLAVIENVIKFLYKNTVDYFSYKNLRLPLNMIIGDTTSATHKIPMTYKDDNGRKIPLTVNVETYLPVFDDKEEGSLRYRGDGIRAFYERLMDVSGTVLDINKLYDDGKYVGSIDSDPKKFKIIEIAGDIRNNLLSLSSKNNNKCLVIANSGTTQYNIVDVIFDGQTKVVFDVNIPVDTEMIKFDVV